MRAPAEVIHAWWPRERSQRWLLVAEPDAPTVVFGSTTSREAFELDAFARRGLRTAQRGSGGGAVVVAPGAQVWIHCYLPAGDPLVDTHLGRSFLWLGDAVAEALGALGVAEVAVVRERLIPTPLSQLVCFAGWGWGEVGVAGRKVAGLAQRRRRDGVMLQLAVLLDNEQALLGDALRVSADGSIAACGLRELGVERADALAALTSAILAR